MIFRPYVHRIMTNRSDSTPTESLGLPDSSPKSVVFPVSSALDLSIIPGSGTKDFFLWHPYQSSVQDVLLGVDTEVAAPIGFTAQMVQKNAGQETVLTDLVSFDTFRISPESLPLPGQVLDGPVFLRVNSPAAAITLLVTIHAMTNEIR